MTTHVVNTHEAKSRLSELIRYAEAGHEVILARGGKPVARLVAMDRRCERTIGAWKGRVLFADANADFVTSDPDVLDLFTDSVLS